MNRELGGADRKTLRILETTVESLKVVINQVRVAGVRKEYGRIK